MLRSMVGISSLVRNKSNLLLIPLATLGLQRQSAGQSATILTWTNGGLTGDWSDSSNWWTGSENRTPIPGDDIVIDSGNADTVHALRASWSIRSLELDSSTLGGIVANNAADTPYTRELSFAKRSGFSAAPSITLTKPTLYVGGIPDGRGQPRPQAHG